jgi:hypothetical protein
MSYTKGPWEIDRTEKYYKPCIRHNGIVIALLARNDAALVMPENQQAEDDANARLIAAAPEMYEALNVALAVIRSPQSFVVEGVCADIERVIRKATGAEKGGK